MAGPEQGYETLLAAIEARNDDDKVWENEDSDDDDSAPGLMDRQDSTVGDEDDDYQRQWDYDSDDEEQEDEEYQPPNRDIPTTPGEVQADNANDAEITGVTERSPIKAPGKATKLSRVGVRRSQRLASKKSLMQEYHLTHHRVGNGAQHPHTDANPGRKGEC